MPRWGVPPSGPGRLVGVMKPLLDYVHSLPHSSGESIGDAEKPNPRVVKAWTAALQEHAREVMLAPDPAPATRPGLTRGRCCLQATETHPLGLRRCGVCNAALKVCKCGSTVIAWWPPTNCSIYGRRRSS